MKLRDALKISIAACYRAAYLLHHALCLRPGEPLKNSQLVVVGSYRAGGAGKTPFCLWMAKQLAARGKHVTLLCHKYAFDEIAMNKSQLQPLIEAGAVDVIATDNRYKTALMQDSGNGDVRHENSRQNCREPNPAASHVILCDDGFEDSRLQPDVTIRLDWEEEPRHLRQLIPSGIFRSLPKDHTATSGQTIALRCFGDDPDVSFRIDSILNHAGENPDNRQSVVVCGLGDPERFVRNIKNAGIIVEETIFRPDHDRNFQAALQQALLKFTNKAIIISEKDSFRVDSSLLENPQIFIAKQHIQISEQTHHKLKSIF